MKKINFKKLDQYCYLITYGDNQANMYTRKIKDLYFVDIAGRYFEAKNFNEIKNKVTGLILSGSLKDHFFDTNY